MNCAANQYGVLRMETERGGGEREREKEGEIDVCELSTMYVYM